MAKKPRRPSPSEKRSAPPPAGAPARVPDVVEPDPQDVYDHSIGEYEADARLDSSNEPPSGIRNARRKRDLAQPPGGQAKARRPKRRRA